MMLCRVQGGERLAARDIPLLFIFSSCYNGENGTRRRQEDGSAKSL
jgi:hypothetical protein